MSTLEHEANQLILRQHVLKEEIKNLKIDITDDQKELEQLRATYHHLKDVVSGEELTNIIDQGKLLRKNIMKGEEQKAILLKEFHSLSTQLEQMRSIEAQRWYYETQKEL